MRISLISVGTNIVATLGYILVPGSCDLAQGQWRYDHFQTATPLQRFFHFWYEVGISTWYGLLWPSALPELSRHNINQLLTLLNWYLLTLLNWYLLTLLLNCSHNLYVNPIWRLFMLCWPSFEVTPEMFNGVYVHQETVQNIQ